VTALDRLRERRARHRERHIVVRMLVALGGFAALLGGVALLVLPGPGIPVVILGLGLLALEFTWAEAALVRALQHARRVQPRRRWQRIAGGIAAVAAAGAAVAFAVWGVPGF
jgi:peptidoglycan/LPS O-acetylase OafA/YrhL